MMDSLTMMRRADGMLFTLTIKGQEHLALWSSLQSALQYKKRNPQLLIFIPASVASPFGQKSLIPLRKEKKRLFLLIDAGGAHLSDGRRLSWEELETHIPTAPNGSTDSLKTSTPNFTGAKVTDSMTVLNQLDDNGGKPDL